MSDHGFWRLSAVELLEGYARKDFSPVEVTEELLGRIERFNPALNAFLSASGEDALAAARCAEKTWLSPGEKPLLCGVPVSIKDTIEMKGLPTTYGSLAFKDNRQNDAELVIRLRRAGAVLLGKTNTPEFALDTAVNNRLSPSGANPWDLEHTCGGSSGGAGAAAAAGLGPIAIGTDSGGSIRLPAAYNGLFGIKPTYQRIPSVQAWRAAPLRSHNGPLTRTVRDSALLLQAIAGPDPRDADSQLAPVDNWLDIAGSKVRGLRIAVSYDFGSGIEIGHDLRRAVDEAAALLAELGCELIETDPPIIRDGHTLEPGVWAYSGDHYNGAESLVPDFWAKHAGDLTDYARPIYEAGRKALAWQYRRILRRNAAYRESLKRWFRGCDALLCPVTGPAPRIADTRARNRTESDFKITAGFLQPFNHGHNPAAAVPWDLNGEGLPIGVQIAAGHGNDLRVLRLSAAIEAARPWAHRWPTLVDQDKTNKAGIALVPETAAY